MGGFKRFLLFVFSLAGLACIAILGMPWFGYGTENVINLIYIPTFWVVLEVLIAMTVLFLVFNLGRALFSRRAKDTINVMSINGGEITVTKAAVASQAGHIVEALGVGTAKDVALESGKNGVVDVHAKVLPYESIDVTAEAPVVHDALVTGLSAMCGEKLGVVSVEFLAPQHGSSLVELDTSDDVSASAGTASEATSAAPSDAAPLDAADATGDITIPMRTEKSE